MKIFSPQFKISFLKQILLLLALGVLFAPMFASAQFVPCDGTSADPCTECHLIEMGNTILVWLIGIMFIIFGFVAAAAGWGFMTAGGNPAAVTAAKSKFTNAFVGILVVLAAWLLVDTIMRQLLVGGDLSQYTGFGVWSEVQCGSMSASQARVTDLVTDASFIGPLAHAGAGGPVTVSSIPGGTSCFPGADGTLGTADDVCVTNDVTGADYAIPPGAPAGYVPPPGFFGPADIAANPQLTPNLRLCDVTNCDASRRRGDYVYVDPAMVTQLELVRADLGGLTVNSGYRSPGYNAGLNNGRGGATHSRHMYGDAVDIAITAGNTEAQIVASCRANGATFTMTYASGSHVHCDWR